MKKIHRFLVKEIPKGQDISITDAEIIHLISHVLKLAVGEECIIFTDGSDDYLCKIKEVAKKTVSLSVVGENKKLTTPKKITACISITKRDSFELIVQKLTELGVQKIIPIVSERTIKQSLRIDRLQKISDEALEQSGGSTRMWIEEPKRLEEALKLSKDKEQYYFDLDGDRGSQPQTTDITFYIGPEGGWSDGDKALFKEYSAKSLKLTETTLRAETAAIVAAYSLLSK
jgi:16S rRNA (uracil1498-N3)-methyltransferase